MFRSNSATPMSRWLEYADSQLSPEAVEYMKLGLYSEFYKHHDEVQSLKKASSLYHFLLERCMNNNKPKALKMFLHVLRGLGGSLRGSLVINEAFGEFPTYKIKDPGLLDMQKVSANFKFFQCLLKIAIKAKKVALGEQLLKRFSKERFLNMNHQLINGLPDLFMRLYQKHLIVANNTHHLIEVLNKYKAWLCLRFLNDYHISVGLQPIPFAINIQSQLGVLDCTSSDPFSMDDSSDGQANNSIFTQHIYDMTELDMIEESDMLRFDYYRTVSDSVTLDGKMENDSDDLDFVDSSETDKLLRSEDAIRGPYGIKKPLTDSSHVASASNQLSVNKIVLKKNRRKPKKNYVCLCLSLTLLILILVTTCTLFGKIWIHLIKCNKTSKVPILQDTETIVGEFKSFYHKTISIGLNNNVTKDMAIDIYKLDSGCDAGKTDKITKNFVLAKTNISKHTPEYALKGSLFEYEISGIFSKPQSVNVCILIGPDYGKGTTKECVKKSLFNSIGRYSVEESNYYYFEVESSDDVKQYWLRVTMKIISIHVTTGELLGCSINVSNKLCRITLPLSLDDKRSFCFIAEFYKYSSDDVPSVELDVRVDGCRSSLALGIPLPFLFIAVIVTLILCLCTVRYFYKFRTHYSEVTIPII